MFVGNCFNPHLWIHHGLISSIAKYLLNLFFISSGLKNGLLFLIAYLNFADLDRMFCVTSVLFGVIGFFDNNLNKSFFSLLSGKYLEGFFFRFE